MPCLKALLSSYIRFRWAQCQIDALSRLRTVKSIRAKLDRLPTTLNETYANILKTVQEEDAELLRRILLWVSFTVVPLTLDELQEAIAVEAGMRTLEEVKESRLNDPKDILSLGSSLLRVCDTGHVKLAHLSVRDYLLSQDIKTHPDVIKFSLDHREANRELATNCITYLSLDSLANGPAKTQDDWERRLDGQALLKHAAKGWTYYLRDADQTSELCSLVSCFFAVRYRPTFMSWIQILNSNWIFRWDEYPRHATSLYYAASFGLLDVVQELIQTGADIDGPGSRFGGTALHGATLREHNSVMQLLLEAGADPSKADFNRVTPLHTAARIGNAEVIRLLLKFGASKTALDSLGESPCDWALQAGKQVSQKLLHGGEDNDSGNSLASKERSVYQRTTAFFPAMAAAQGLIRPSVIV